MSSINTPAFDFRIVRYFTSIILLAIVMAFATGSAYAQELSKSHAINMDPQMKKRIGPKVLSEVNKFFHDAELAIENRNLSGLMRLYSDNYLNSHHDKSGAEKIWERIFQTFENLASIHNMRLVNYAPDSKLIVIRCSGLLLGKPVKSRDEMIISFDSWTNQDHILSKATGEWKLIGTTGDKEKKRFWFDKPMHPLF